MKRSVIWLMAVACAIAVANLYYNQPLLVDIQKSFGISVRQAGMVPTLMQVGYAIGLLLFVPLGDSHERRGLVVRVLSLTAFFLAMFALSPGFVWLAVASLAIGTTSISAQLLLPFAAELADPEERGSVLGRVMSGLLIGILLARTFSGFIGGYFGWRAMYGLACLLTAGLAVAIRFMLPTSLPRKKLSYRELISSLPALIREQPILREASLTGAMLFAAFSAFWATLIFLVSTTPYHYGSQVAGLFGLVGAVGATAAPYAGKLADRRGPRLALGFAIAFVIVSFVIMAGFGYRLWGLALGVIFMDLGVQAAQVSNQTRVYSLLDQARNRLNTVFMVSYFIGGSLGSYCGVYAWSIWRWYGVCGVGILFSALALAFFAWGSSIRRALRPKPA